MVVDKNQKSKMETDVASIKYHQKKEYEKLPTGVEKGTKGIRK